MDTLISRITEDQLRCFPHLYTIRPNRGSQTSPGANRRATHLTIYYSELQIPYWKWMTGWWLKSPEQLARLLRFYRLAIQAEQSGTWDRADYLWDLALEQWKPLLHNKEIWESLYHELSRHGGGDLNSAENCRKRFVQEIFIDTHCAFYNGYIEQGTIQASNNRAFAHYDRIITWLTYADLPIQQLQRLLLPASLKWTELCEQEKKWDLGLRVCQETLRFLPEERDLIERCARFIFMRALSPPEQLNSIKDTSQRVKSIQEAISQLQNLRQTRKELLMLYVLLANLYHQHAIALANSGQLAEAIVSAQKALIYHPVLQEAKVTFDKLIGTMKALQEGAEQVRQDLRTNSRARLTAEGMQFLKEASLGFAPLEKFIHSDEAAHISRDYYKAQGIEIWRTIGLPETEIVGEEVINALLEGMSEVMNADSVDPNGIAQEWQKVVAEKPILAELDSAKICAYLVARKNREANAGDDLVQIALPQPINPPLLDLSQVKRRQGGEPMGLWFFSRQDKRLKLQALFALLLLIFAGTFFLQQTKVRQARQAAYDDLARAVQQQNYLGVMEAAEQYFSNKPVMRDLRDREVNQLYDEAFVRWSVTSATAPEADAMVHINFYKHHFQEVGYTGDEQP